MVKSINHKGGIMINSKTLLILILLILVPLSLFSEKIAVLDFKPIGVEPSLVEAITTLLKGDLSSYKEFTLITVEEKKICEDKECAAEIGFKVMAQKVVYGTVSKLGTKYIISASVVEVSSHNIIYQDRISAASAEDLDIASERLAKSIATGKKVEATAEIGLITEEEAKEPRRRQSFYTVGSKFGMGMPLGDTYGGTKTLMSLDAIFWYETPSFIAEFSGGYTFTPFSTEIASNYTTVTAMEFTFSQLSLFYLFSKGDFCPYAGGGIGMKNLWIYKHHPEFWETDMESAFGMGLNANAGLIAFRTYDFRLLIDVEYSLNMANVGEEFGGPHHSLGVSFGFTYRRQTGGGCGGGGFGCVGVGCL